MTDQDEIAAKYYQSGRTLKIQVKGLNEWVDDDKPWFVPSRIHRIKPERKKVRLLIYKAPGGNFFGYPTPLDAPTNWTKVGEAEMEVDV
jgi:hypothetical protein